MTREGGKLPLLQSSKTNPCPICGRVEDGDCRIRQDGKLVLCHTGKTRYPPVDWVVGEKREVNGERWIRHEDPDTQQGSWTFAVWEERSQASSYSHAAPNNCQLIDRSKPKTSAPPVGGLAYLPNPTEPPPQKLADGTWLKYDGLHGVKVLVSAVGKKSFIPHHWDSGQKDWVSSKGDNPWPLYNQQEALDYAPGSWIVETEGEKCADMVRAGGLVCISQPGFSRGKKTIDEITSRYSVLTDYSIKGIVYIADNDEKGKEYVSLFGEAALKAGLKFVGINASEIWNGLPDGGSVDDAPGTFKQRCDDIEKAFLQKKEEQSVVVVREKNFSELLDEMLDFVFADDESEMMRVRAEIISRFRISESQIEAKLFKLHMKRSYGITAKSDRKALDLSKVGGLDFIVPGFIIDKKLNLIYGCAGSGKTTAALAAAFASILGTGFLDHDAPAKKTKVLFIASDSGPAPLVASLSDMGMIGRPETTPGPDQKFFVWAADADQNQQKWICDLKGCIELEKFIVENGIGLILIDSCKAVCTGGSADYTSNGFVMGLLTWFEEVICRHAAVLWINHDGRAAGATAGAKAWAEVPSAVHEITMPPDDSENRDIRTWIVRKNRISSTRRFTYTMNDGQIEVSRSEHRFGNCLAQITEELYKSRLEGRDHMTRQQLYDALCNLGGHTKKTVSNTLSIGVRAKDPEIQPKNGVRGGYQLTRRMVEELDAIYRMGEAS